MSPDVREQSASLALTTERLGHEVDHLRLRLSSHSVSARLFGPAGEARRQELVAELVMAAAVLAHVADRLSTAEAAAALAERHRPARVVAAPADFDLDLLPVEVVHA